MFIVVEAVFQQIMTELNGAESEEDRIMAITEIILKLMKQNGCWSVYCTCIYEYTRVTYKTVNNVSTRNLTLDKLLCRTLTSKTVNIDDMYC
jgi:hypothetical protein